MWASKTHTFSPSTVAKSAEVNDNFDDMVDQLNIAMPSSASGHGIILFSGAIADIPSGWYLCDGSNSTPNLRDRFVVGAGSSYAVGDTGGEANHVLTEAEMPSHVHSAKVQWGTSDGQNRRPETGSGNYAGTGATTQNTDATGSGSAHENRPPYYALAYIMKS